MELSDLIRMNRLVRGRIDLAGFQTWYDSLSAEAQVVLLYHLHEFAQEAGYTKALYQQALEQALQATQLTADHPLVSQLNAFRECFPLRVRTFLPARS